MKKTKAELLARQREINDKFGEMYEKAEQEKRELNDAEKLQEAALKREYENNQREISLYIQQSQDKALEAQQREQINKAAQMREFLKDARDNGQKREILLNGADSATNTIAASGAIALTIHDIIPTLNEGLGLPKDLEIVTGVTGNQVWPVSVDDVEVQEVGEMVALDDQNLDFTKITASPARGGMNVKVSNSAIDNAAFDVYGYIVKKFTVAMKKYLAKKVYSQANFTGIHGPFKGLASKGNIEIGPGAYRAILEAVADFVNAGIPAESICLSMDATTEAILKATQKGANTAGYIIENGKCAGYEYVVSHYVNTKLGTGANANKLVSTPDKYIGIGCYSYLLVQFHGVERFSADNTSNAVALLNCLAVCMNFEASITEITPYNEGTAVKAFALYKVTEPAAASE